MRAMVLLGLGAVGWSGCQQGSSQCGEAECAAVCGEEAMAEGAAPGGATMSLSPFEQEILRPALEDLRGGVRPFHPDGIGICRGKRDCDEYLGADPGSLAEGDYILMAELRVPKVAPAAGWTIELAVECETTVTSENGESSSKNNNVRTYDVRYTGEQRGYRLMPLRTIHSPSPRGTQKCAYTITAPHPDGDKVYTGSWSLPEKPAE